MESSLGMEVGRWVLGLISSSNLDCFAARNSSNRPFLFGFTYSIDQSGPISIYSQDLLFIFRKLINHHIITITSVVRYRHFYMYHQQSRRLSPLFRPVNQRRCRRRINDIPGLIYLSIYQHRYNFACFECVHVGRLGGWYTYTKMFFIHY